MPQEAAVKLLALLVASPIVFLINISPSKAFRLDFSNTPTLSNGTDLSVGAEYRYSNVATFNGITIGAILIIDDLKNSAFLNNIDLNSPGVSENIQIELNGPNQPTTQGSGPRAEFTLEFFNSSTSNLVLLDGLEVSGIDIDGDDNPKGSELREGIRFYDATSVDFGSRIQLTETGTNSRGSYREFFPVKPTGSAGITSGASNKATAFFPDQLNSFKFDYLFSIGGNNANLSTVNSLEVEALSAIEVPFQFCPTLGLFISIMSIMWISMETKTKN